MQRHVALSGMKAVAGLGIGLTAAWMSSAPAQMSPAATEAGRGGFGTCSAQSTQCADTSCGSYHEGPSQNSVCGGGTNCTSPILRSACIAVIGDKPYRPVPAPSVAVASSRIA
jgi:hypothetical protein